MLQECTCTWAVAIIMICVCIPTCFLILQEDPAAQKDLLKVACRYENAFEYQNVLAPLVQIEADYDKVR